MQTSKATSPSLPLDMEKFNIITGGRYTHKEELLELFFQNSAECIAVMESHSATKWKKAAQELKNLSASIGAQELYEICMVAEKIDDIKAEDAKKMLDNIKIYLQRLRAFVRNTGY